MATTSPTRIDDELYNSAKLVAEIMSRSTAQQIAHWARIGRELEASAGVSPRAVAEVLAGRRDYDALDAREQAIVRAEWTERLEERRAALDLAEAFTAEGQPWVELDDDGNVVHGGAGHGDDAAAGS
jgi:hypothetical protein